MSVLCPTCHKLVDIVRIEKSEGSITYTYSCGHRRIEIFVAETVHIHESLRLRVKDSKDKKVLESKVEGKTQKRISRKPSKAIQIVWEEGEIVHIHCKSADCLNEWKIEQGIPIKVKFDITPTEQGNLKVTCKKCGRQYLAG
jgi:hypothetical protein